MRIQVSIPKQHNNHMEGQYTDFWTKNFIKRILKRNSGKHKLPPRGFQVSKACGSHCVAISSIYLESLDFTSFSQHKVFVPNEEDIREKSIKNKIHMSVGIEL